MILIPEFRNECREIEKLIFDNEDTFMSAFLPCNWNAELIHVRFSSETIEFVSLLESGKHVVDGITWNEFREWLNNLPQ